MKTYKLHLIRHGLTRANLEGIYAGSGTDLPLCPEGRAQLEALRRDFEYPNVPLVITSPMLRARETADILYPGIKQIGIDDLREINLKVKPRQNSRATRIFTTGLIPASRLPPRAAKAARSLLHAAAPHCSAFASS